jgi:transcriptional regulator with XRE-family HTH domain
MAKDICVRLGLKIRELRKKRKWSQIYLAVHTGLSRTFISDIELGRKEPCLRSLEILALGFEVKLSDLSEMSTKAPRRAQARPFP